MNGSVSAPLLSVCCVFVCVCVYEGLMVTERNWLLVFQYTTWGGNANLPHFVEGMEFTPTEVQYTINSSEG